MIGGLFIGLIVLWALCWIQGEIDDAGRDR